MIGRMHHIGFVVSSIEAVAESFSSSMACTWAGKIFEDPIQRVRVSFFEPAAAGQPQLELVEPGEGASPVRRYLEERGGGLHHVCYETPDLDEEIRRARAAGAALVQKPVPAVAFGGARIAWIYTRQRLLVEYLET